MPFNYLDDEINISALQRDAVLHPGNFFLTACPGSGKTRTVGVRVAYWSTTPDADLGRVRRVAATSFTNTAVDEITASAEQAGCPVREPNFVGTIHRFLLRYVVRPFGKPVMQCDHDQPLKVVAFPEARRSPEETFPHRYRYTDAPISAWTLDWQLDGSVYVTQVPYALASQIDREALSRRIQEPGRRSKFAIARRGLLSMSDIPYWAMRVLEDDDICAIVASRFDELIVDEVQDSSDIQQMCIRRLCEHGLKSVVYAGDLDQAIYEFARARPDELHNLVEYTTSHEIRLTENWRSSQLICNVTHYFRAESGSPDRAVGLDKDAPHQPEVITYEGVDLRNAVSKFTSRLSQLNLNPELSVVLCRAGSAADRIRGGADISLGRGLRVLLTAAESARSNERIERDVVLNLERLVIGILDEDADIDLLEADDRLQLRLQVMTMLDSLPPFDLGVKEWVTEARQVIRRSIAGMDSVGTTLGQRFRTPQGVDGVTMQSLLSRREIGPKVQTVHSVKGESHDATLLIAVERDRSPQNWDAWLGEAGQEEERVAYVALTRARRYMAIALPESCPPEVVQRFLERGFIHSQES